MKSTAGEPLIPMKLYILAPIFAIIAFLSLWSFPTVHGGEPVPVTVDNFVRAETDLTFQRYIDASGLGRFVHLRVPAPVESDRQDVIRTNRDTLYSTGVFDLTNPVTIVKPDPGTRFQSMLVINQDHSIPMPVQHEAGEFTLTQDEVQTRYVMVLFRTFADPNDEADLKAANELQDQIMVKQDDKGAFEIPNWDQASLKKVRDAIIVLAETRSGSEGYFGKKENLNPLYHLLGTAVGWGGNPPEAAMYATVWLENNDGKTPYALTVKDVPVDGFWSVTVYNEDGYLEPNERNLYSYNNVTAERSDDGSVTIHFGGDPDAINYLPITEGWNYVARMYRPRQEIIDGEWTFPAPEEIR